MKVVRKAVRHKARYFRGRWIAALSVIAVTVAMGGFIYGTLQATDEKVARIRRESDAYVHSADQQLDAIKARKAEEARIAAEKAAHDAAEQARTAGPQTSNEVDAKTCNSSLAHADPARVDVLVNKKHCIQPLAFEPDDLVLVYGATLSQKAAESFRELYLAASAAGLPFSVTSSYRSYDNQISTYNYWVSVSGRDGADTYSARPGYSEHQTGLAIDIAAGGCSLSCFGSTAQYQWMQQHAAEYGFIQRYYAGEESITGFTAEEWHYRYVGVETALSMRQKGIRTLEAFWGVSGGQY